MGPAVTNTSEQNKRRRRRKKARTEDFSSDSSDSSDSSNSESSDKDEDDDDVNNITVDDMNIDGEEEQTKVHSSNIERPIIPQALTEAADKSEFEDYYVQLMTKQFGDDLNKLRQSNDFQEKSLFMLINALKQGTNVFDPEQQKIILNKQS